MKNLWIVFAILTTNTGIAYQAVLVASDRKPSVQATAQTSVWSEDTTCQSLVTGESCQGPVQKNSLPPPSKRLYTMLNGVPQSPKPVLGN